MCISGGGAPPVQKPAPPPPAPTKLASVIESAKGRTPSSSAQKLRAGRNALRIQPASGVAASGGGTGVGIAV